ncbi:MAG TPA: hypothetical protein VGM88_28850 [Kofleriaceae bacterium]|jgi:hypothetical protein
MRIVLAFCGLAAAAGVARADHNNLGDADGNHLFTFGAAWGTLPDHIQHGQVGGMFPTHYDLDQSSAEGIHGSYVRTYSENFVIGFDGIGLWSPMSGQVYDDTSPSSTGRIERTTTPQPPQARFSGSFFDIDTTVRLGVRAPMAHGRIALSAGSGLGVSVWKFKPDMDPPDITNGETRGNPPSGYSLDLHVPAWAQLVVKLGCQWGGSVMGTYDYDPLAGDSQVIVLAGASWQPDVRCR